MIKRLASAPGKKTKKVSMVRRAKSKKAPRVASQTKSSRGSGEDQMTLAAEQIFSMYDATEAKHAKA